MKIWAFIPVTLTVKSIGTIPVSTASIYRYGTSFGRSHCGTTKYRYRIVKFGTGWWTLKFYGEFESRNSLQNPRESVKFRQIKNLSICSGLHINICNIDTFYMFRT